MKVLRDFKDITTGKKYKAGDNYTGPREKELCDLGVLEKELKVDLEDKNAAPKKRRTKKK